MTVTATIGADHLAVRLRTDDLIPAVLDMLADAYGDDPETIGQLLIDLAAAQAHLSSVQHDQERRDLPEWMVTHAAEVVDKYREELAEAAITEHAESTLNYREALALADGLTGAAAQTLTARLIDAPWRAA
ncbi:hypothetical protein [Streptacidiphilus albus]|uniref:hypothetical protein n=1 Tax=Streptacidiphilus albus TaxID=105425 RepID=UPI00054B81DE|nr:hypothetical protein [Streptacidiphilus albus]